MTTDVFVKQSEFTNILLEAEFSSVEINNEKIENGEIFSEIIIPNTHQSGVIGSPQIPVLRRIIEIPADAQVSVRATSGIEKTIILNNRVYPLQPPVEKILGALVEFKINSDKYLAGNIYGEELVKIVDQGYIRGHHFVTIEIYPVKYDPKLNKLVIRENINVELILGNSNAAKTQYFYNRYNNMQMNSFLEKTLLNANTYGDGRVPTTPIGYLIITPDNYESQLSEFIEWKRQKGFYVTVANKTTAGATSTAIKSYIQNAYDTWVIPPQYVLLIGDGDMPAYTGQSSYEITDHPYGQLQGGDALHDVWLGRWSISTPTELDNIIEKTLNYEKPSDWTSGTAWCKKAVFMASTDNYQITEGTHRWVIQNYMGSDGFACDTLWNHSGATTGQVSTAFNNGRSWGVFSGHGATTYWDDGPHFGQSEVNALTNQDMYSIVQSYACITGQWSVSECFAETWIRAADKGAVSFWASSPSSFWTEDDTLERWVFMGLYDSSINNLRGFLDYGMYGVYLAGSSVNYYFDAYNLMGDPSIDAWTGYPVTPSVNYQDTLPIGIVNVQVSVDVSKAPFENALVAISNDDSLWTAYTNSSGIANIQVSTTTSESLLVVVTGHNLEPYFGYIEINSAGVDEGLSHPVNEFALNRAYPNPVRGKAMIAYSIGAESSVRLVIYDISGREVNTLVNMTQAAGRYRVEWDGRDNRGSLVSSGTYFYRLQAGSFNDGSKLVVVR